MKHIAKPRGDGDSLQCVVKLTFLVLSLMRQNTVGECLEVVVERKLTVEFTRAEMTEVGSMGGEVPIASMHLINTASMVAQLLCGSFALF